LGGPLGGIKVDGGGRVCMSANTHGLATRQATCELRQHPGSATAAGQGRTLQAAKNVLLLAA
jgi:hypothetical protein